MRKASVLDSRNPVIRAALLNALVGEKLSIVTPRPQTTRHRILGVCHLPDAQIAFLDTPGLHRGQKRALNRAMNRTASAALGESDVGHLIVEAMFAGEFICSEQADMIFVAWAGTTAQSMWQAMSQQGAVDSTTVVTGLAEKATRPIFGTAGS